MDSGYKITYSDKRYLITDESEYFVVYEDYKQIAAFKTQDLALQYVLYLKGLK